MFQKLKVNKKILNLINIELLYFSRILLKKKYKNLDEMLLKLSNKDERVLFDAFNVSLKIYELLDPIKKFIEKKTKKKLILWTYPQVRIDIKKKNFFSAPLHKDQWILSKKDFGYIAWIPINKKGGSLKFYKGKESKLKIKKNNYWGLEFIKKNIKTKKQIIHFGEALIFDHNTIHESDTDNQRISVQFRFKEFKKSFKNRDINQVINSEIKKYWIKNYNAK